MKRRTLLWLAPAFALLAAAGVFALLTIDGGGTRRPAVIEPPGRGISSEAMLLDLGGDSIYVGGQTQTSLFGSSRRIRWTGPSEDDAFLAVDATSARDPGGFDIRNRSGFPLSGVLLVRGGIDVVDGGRGVFEADDCYEMLAAFDRNGDAKISPADQIFGMLKLFRDVNADGVMASGELTSPPSNANVSWLNVGGVSGQTTDQYGNRHRQGTFRRTNGTNGVADCVLLASVS